MHLDPASDRPVFLQIADALRRQIASGVYLAGESVPSIRVLARDLKINPNTVKRACEQLQRDGVLEARSGLGLFVAPGAGRAARDDSRKALRQALADAVRTARAAGLADSDIDAAFRAAIDQRSRAPLANREPQS